MLRAIGKSLHTKHRHLEAVEKIAAALDAATAAVERQKAFLAGRDPARPYIEFGFMPTTPEFIQDVCIRAGVKQIFLPSEAEKLRALQNRWDKLEALMREASFDRASEQFAAQYTSPLPETPAAFAKLEFRTVAEIKEQISAKRQALRTQFRAITTEAAAICEKILHRVEACAKTVYDEVLRAESAQALRYQFKPSPSQFLIAVGQLSWKFRDQISNWQAISAPPRGLIPYLPEWKDIFDDSTATQK